MKQIKVDCKSAKDWIEIHVNQPYESYLKKGYLESEAKEQVVHMAYDNIFRFIATKDTQLITRKAISAPASKRIKDHFYPRSMMVALILDAKEYGTRIPTEKQITLFKLATKTIRVSREEHETLTKMQKIKASDPQYLEGYMATTGWLYYLGKHARAKDARLATEDELALAFSLPGLLSEGKE